MSGPEFLEVFVSLSFQVALLVMIAHGLARFVDREAVKSRIWAGCHYLMLALTLRAVLLPRFRPRLSWFPVESSLNLQFAHWQERLGYVLFVIWAAGAVCSLMLFLINCFQVQRFLKSCHPILDRKLLQVLQSQAANDQDSLAEVQFLTSRRLNSPFCWQVHRPLIVLPEFLTEFEPEEIRLIVRHEWEHLRAGHPLTLFVQRLVEMLFWFHPLVWWSSGRSALNRELACDEAAVTCKSDIAHYLRSLLKIVERAEDEADSQTVELAFGRGRRMIARRATRLAAMARNGLGQASSPSFGRLVLLAEVFLAIGIAWFVWTPIDLTKSPRAKWSPWPTWTARALHSVGVNARDYDIYDHRYQAHEVLEDQAQGKSRLTDSVDPL